MRISDPVLVAEIATSFLICAHDAKADGNSLADIIGAMAMAFHALSQEGHAAIQAAKNAPEALTH